MAKEILSAPSNANYQVVNGITYFKLRSEFPGDYTKNCGLLGNEIDENFYFLRGYDIKEVSYDPETKILTIKRVDDDYEPIEIPLGDEIAKDRPDFSYDKDKGELLVSYPDGTEVPVDGFFIENDLKVSTNPSIKGDGRPSNPLRLSPVERTGMYAPVSKMYDLTNGEEVPENLPCGARYITKEQINPYGKLYDYSDLPLIQEALEAENHGWRIPTDKDWVELFDAMEDEDSEEDRNHGAGEHKWLGNVAGAFLKSDKDWRECDAEEIIGGLNYYGFNALPAGYYSDANGQVRQGERAYFWAYDPEDEGSDETVKTLAWDKNTILNDDYSKNGGNKFSLRFVKDYEPDCANEYEDILGTNLPTGVIAKCDYSKVWTLANFDGDFPGLTGQEIEGDDAEMRTVYFINEVGENGVYRKKMNEGDAVYNTEDGNEYRIIDDELVNSFDKIQDMFDETSDRIDDLVEDDNIKFDEISGNIETLLSDVEKLNEDVSGLSGTVETEIERALAAEEELSEKLDEISGVTEGLVSNLDELSSSTETFKQQIVELTNDLGEGLSSIEDNLSALTETVENEIPAIKEDLSSLHDEVSASVSTITNDLSALSAKTEEAIAAMSGLSDTVETAIDDAKNEAIEEAKEYVDDKVETLTSHDEVRITDIVYNEQIGYIYLQRADGSRVGEIDTSAFIKDEVLERVELSDSGEYLRFVWRNENHDITEIPLSSFANIYNVASASTTYLRLNGKELSAIVDGEGGFGKTLASTAYVDNAVNAAASAAVAPIRTYIDILNGDDTEQNSIAHKIGDKLITDGITDGEVEHSLMKIVNVNGELKYYVSSKAKDMYYVKPDGTTTNLNEYVTSLENRVAELESGMTRMEDRVQELEAAGVNEDDVKDIIKNYLIGTELEIKLTEEGNKLRIGFTDDAIFGDYLAAPHINPDDLGL